MAADGSHDLVPIQLAIRVPGYELVDKFCWDPTATNAELEHFAQAICKDMGLPAHIFVPFIRGEIRQQVEDHEFFTSSKHKAITERLEAIRCH